MFMTLFSYFNTAAWIRKKNINSKQLEKFTRKPMLLIMDHCLILPCCCRHPGNLVPKKLLSTMENQLSDFSYTYDNWKENCYINQMQIKSLILCWNNYCVHLLIFILPRILCFMSSNDGKEIILLEKITTGCIAIEIWTSSDRIMREVLRVFLISKIFQWIRPQQITHGTKCWGLLEAIKLKNLYIYN